MKSQELCLFVFPLLMLLCVSGCFSVKPENTAAFVKPHEASVTATEYAFQPPDELSVHCSKVTEIDG